MLRKCVPIILAAGKGTRMKSKVPKVLHKIYGRPMVHCLVDVVRFLKDSQPIVVTSYKAETVEEHLDNKVKVIKQVKPLGTADAVNSARGHLANFDGDVLILYADTPLIKSQTLERLLLKHNENGSACTLLTAVVKNPSGYGRILKDGNNNVLRIVEEKDASLKEKAVKEINVGAYCFRSKDLFKALEEVKPNSGNSEYYLTDTISILVNEGSKVDSISTADYGEFMGINSRADLFKAQCIVGFRNIKRFIYKRIFKN